MSKRMNYIIIAFLVFLSGLFVITIPHYKTAEMTAVYTRNNLSWSGAELLEDGSVKLRFTNGKTTVRLKNDVSGNIGYNVYLYAENEVSSSAEFLTKNMTEINKNEYPDSLKERDVKYAYRGYLEGDDKKVFEIKSTDAAGLMLLIIIEDNNSYPKEEKSTPTVANIKFNAEVLLDGQYSRGNNYSFSLKDEKGVAVETVHNDDGDISFSNIALKEKGTYIYYLSQNEGKDEETTYDKSVYKITVVAEEKNAAKVYYEKDGTPKQTLPRFSNYKNNKDIIDIENIAEYPTNEKQSKSGADYLLISTLAICALLILFCIVIHHRKG